MNQAPESQGELFRALRQVMPRRPLTAREAYAFAETQANTLLIALNINSPPVPDYVIEDVPWVSVVRTSLDGRYSGVTAWQDGRWVIRLDRSESLNRQRFSLMHEAKHALDAPLADTIYSRLSARQVERVCDHFAACVLMPKRLLKQLWARGIDDPEDLADCFQVSQAAMRVRLQVLRRKPGPAARFLDACRIPFTATGSGDILPGRANGISPEPMT